MMRLLSSVSLLWKILLSTSIALTLLFGISGWIVQEQFIRIASLELEQEVRTSFQAYDSLWRARADRLASISLVLSRMSDVRAAFGTGDAATIRDTAAELWQSLSRDGTMFLVADPSGHVIASLGDTPAAPTPTQSLPEIQFAVVRFPRQATGYLALNHRLYQVVITPVYVAGGKGSALLNVLVAGFTVDEGVALQLKEATGGSDFVFLSQGLPIASTFDTKTAGAVPSLEAAPEQVRRVRLAGSEYSQFMTPLLDLEGKPNGQLRILRSDDASRKRLIGLRTRMIAIWLVAVIAGFAFTFALARHILKPVKALDNAAAEIGRGNYNAHVDVDSADEMGRLAHTFNDMCASIRNAREDLIRNERIDTIGRLSTSIIHDLRNPLAAIYGGAEMLVDGDLSEAQLRRLAANIYRSSRRVQELLQELADVTRGHTHGTENCRLREVVAAAFEPLSSAADSQNVAVTIDIPAEIEVNLDRSPMERVFSNLIGNSIEAMPEGGQVHITAMNGDSSVTITVEDTGPGIPHGIGSRLFQPFVTAGKKNGIGLGLALSRQIVLDHGGDLWVDLESSAGARFFVRLPG